LVLLVHVRVVAAELAYRALVGRTGGFSSVPEPGMDAQLGISQVHRNVGRWHSLIIGRAML
jgi:hypothetical protein